MSLSAPLALVAFTLLARGAQAAEPPRLPECDTVQERFELLATPAPQVHEVCISPGLATMFVFAEGELSPASGVESTERFRVVEVGKRTLSLLPSDKVVAGERLKLTVHFTGAEVPATATFTLVVHPARAARQVEVFRTRRTVASYQQAEKEHSEKLRQCREENERLNAKSGAPSGLTGLITTKLLGLEGVTAKRLMYSATLQPAGAVEAQEARSFRATGVVAVDFKLGFPKGTAPWVAAGAALTGPGGRPLRVLSVWQAPEPDAEGRVRVVVEADSTGVELGGNFTLKVWNEAGTSSFTLTGVSFP